jgi:antitoxin CptB
MTVFMTEAHGNNMMNPTQRKAKIRYRSRRGMLELDVLFSRFLAAKLDSMSAAELEILEQLLEQNDPDLYAWLMGYETSSKKELADFVLLIRSYYHDTPLS